METVATDKQAIRILFLASEPTDTGKLRLGAELQEIRNRLSKNPAFEIVDRLAVKPDDVQQTILSYKPHIVHFSGHGQDTGEICFEDEKGNSKVIPPDALAELFSLVADHIKCVVVNTCYSDKQAKAIARYVPIVIGTRKEITDGAAIKFSIGFYTALVSNPDLSQISLKEDFRSGCIAIKFESLPEDLTPVILEGSPEVMFSSEVDTAFLQIQKPKGLIFNTLVRGLSLTGKRMGVSEDVVARIIDEKITRLELHNSGVLEYEKYLKDILRDEYPLSEQSMAALLQLQNGLGLSNDDAASVRNKVLNSPGINTPEKWYDRGRGQSDLANYEKAIEYLTNAIEKDPDYSGAYFERGYCYDKLGDFDNSIADFTKSIEFNNKWELSSNLSLAYYSRGLSYFSKRSDDENVSRNNMSMALQDWNRSIDLNPNEPNAYYNRGLVHEFFDDLQKAVIEYKKSYDMHKTEESKKTVSGRLARCYNILGDIDQYVYWRDISVVNKGLGELAGHNDGAN